MPRYIKLQEFAAHTGNVNCVKIGRKSSGVLVTGGDDKKVNLWTVGTQSRTMSLAGHQTPVESVTFDVNEEVVAAGASSGSIKLFDLEQAGKVTRALTGHRSNVKCLDFSTHGLLSGSMDTNVKLWDLRGKDAVTTCKGHKAAVTHVRWSPDGKWAASGSEDGEVKIFDICAGRVINEFNQHTHSITGLEFHPEEYLMATCSADKTVKVWDLEAMRLLESTPPEATGIRALAFNTKGCLFSAVQDGLRVWQWEPPPAVQLDSLDVPWSKVSDLTLIKDKNKLIGCSFNKAFVGLWVVDLKDVCSSGAGITQSQDAPFGVRAHLTPEAAYPLGGYPAADRQQQVAAVPPNLQDYALRRQGRGSAAEGLGSEAGRVIPEAPASGLSPVPPLLRGDQYPSSYPAAVRQPRAQQQTSPSLQQVNYHERSSLQSSSRGPGAVPAAPATVDVSTSGQGPPLHGNGAPYYHQQQAAGDLQSSSCSPLLPAQVAARAPLERQLPPLPELPQVAGATRAAPVLVSQPVGVSPPQPQQAAVMPAAQQQQPATSGHAGKPGMVSVGVGVGDSLFRGQVEPGALHKLAQQAAGPGFGPGGGWSQHQQSGMPPRAPPQVGGPVLPQEAPYHCSSSGNSRDGAAAGRGPEAMPGGVQGHPALAVVRGSSGQASDAELIDAIAKGADEWGKVLPSRAAGVRALRSLIDKRDLRSALAVARRQQDPTAAADVLGVLSEHHSFGSQLSLDLVPDLVHVLGQMLASQQPNHQHTALNLGLTVVKCFGPMIREVCINPAVNARVVDMAYEQRRAKCETARMVLQSLKSRTAWIAAGRGDAQQQYGPMAAVLAAKASELSELLAPL